MLNRPVLSLKKKQIQKENIKPETKPKEKTKKQNSENEKAKEQRALEHKKSIATAKKEKQKRIKDACKTLESLNLKAPLKIGIGSELIQLIKKNGHSFKASKAAINRWVTSPVYLNLVVQETHRFNIDGTPAQEITDKEKEYSLKLLKRHEKEKVT